jgi:hypothetical protein
MSPHNQTHNRENAIFRRNRATETQPAINRCVHCLSTEQAISTTHQKVRKDRNPFTGDMKHYRQHRPSTVAGVLPSAGKDTLHLNLRTLDQQG